MNNPCGRDALQKLASDYLAAMTAGSTAALRLHASVRYTENGQAQRLGLGIWSSRPRVEFARHIIDEARCSSVSVAVLGPELSRIVFGVRLRYVDQQLFEAEAQVVPRNGAYYEPAGLIPSGPDPWIEPVPEALRMSRDALNQLAADYFDATADTSLLPAHAPSCRRRQNGALMGPTKCRWCVRTNSPGLQSQCITSAL
jgi:hypothetical protein